MKTDTKEKKGMRRQRLGLEVCCHQPRNAQGHQAGRGRKDPATEAAEGARPCPHLDLGLLSSRTVRD